MFYSFSTTHCKTRSYKGMRTMNVEGVESSSNLFGERLNQLSPPNTVCCTIYTLLASERVRYSTVPKT